MANFDEQIKQMMANQPRMMQQAPQQMRIDPVTPVILEQLVKNSNKFSEALFKFVVADLVGQGLIKEKALRELYLVCFQTLRPINSQVVPREAVQQMFFDMYVGNSPNACLIEAAVLLGLDEEVDGKTINNKTFQKNFDELSAALFGHFVEDEKAELDFVRKSVDKFLKDLFVL